MRRLFNVTAANLKELKLWLTSRGKVFVNIWSVHLVCSNYCDIIAQHDILILQEPEWILLMHSQYRIIKRDTLTAHLAIVLKYN